jgi:hypothetical protein
MHVHVCEIDQDDEVTGEAMDKMHKDVQAEAVRRTLTTHQMVPVSSIKPLPENIASRPFDQKHADTLRVEINRNGYDVGKPVKLILVGAKTADKRPFVTTGASGTPVSNWDLIFSHGTLYPVAGNHRTRAMKTLSAAYPLGKQWQHIPAVVYHIPEGITEDTLDFILSIGGIDNRGDTVKKHVTFSQRLMKMHQHLTATFGDGKAGSVVGAGTKNESMIRLKKRWQIMWGVDIKKDYTVAQWHSRPFSLLMRLLDNDNVIHKGSTSKKLPQPPTNSSKYAEMNALHDDDKCALLQAHIDGHTTPSEFSAAIVKIRNTMTVRDRVLTHMECETWDDLIATYPAVEAFGWLQEWIRTLTSEYGNKVIPSRGPTKFMPSGKFLEELEDIKNKVQVRGSGRVWACGDGTRGWQAP